ncbi:MAG TPA: ribonuclease catalytic domain-containing protein [Edaphobacter sp.]|uniref:ribonuclease catalytic domain-containing protein n=1 Tax=Edaphobacter sp. TaxID=1934404 RepID=UPI002C7B7342|nr:ribonuclease catalytic domain-containing protein [Edaphobacter sp.]HUZ97325.1 ribonuclease catalytic domain-containing protein [Edaphobacter sp.]
MSTHTFDLAASASAEMIREGFQPDFPTGSEQQVEEIRADGHAARSSAESRDLRSLLWSSIDNDTSRDLDQIEVAEQVNGGIRIRVGVADVSASVLKDTPIDEHAAQQTQTVYTAVRNFPMLPNELSTDLTSLNENEDRAAMVVELVVDTRGVVGQTSIYRAVVRNKAQLAYSKVGPWLEGAASPDDKVGASAELQAQLRLQDEAAVALRAERVRQGALEFNHVEADPVVVDGQVHEIKTAEHNLATDLIEEFMIAANGTMARTLREAHRSCIRRVVRSPKRWDRIVELAGRNGTKLPPQPDSGALNAFLQVKRVSDPIHYPDLALAVIKLMGPGEYVLTKGDDADPLGHFGLAAEDYAHSTAPNRRFADLVTQRVVKAMLDNEPPPYNDEELAAIAQQCNLQEAAARKVERTMEKRVAAVALADSIGKTFHGVITGSGDKGVYVRVFHPPVEGKMVRGEQGLDVGDTVDVTLLHTDPQHAFIDFGRA